LLLLFLHQSSLLGKRLLNRLGISTHPMDHYWREHAIRCLRRFFVLSKRHLGLGPHALQGRVTLFHFYHSLLGFEQGCVVGLADAVGGAHTVLSQARGMTQEGSIAWHNLSNSFLANILLYFHRRGWCQQGRGVQGFRAGILARNLAVDLFHRICGVLPKLRG